MKSTEVKLNQAREAVQKAISVLSEVIADDDGSFRVEYQADFVSKVENAFSLLTSTRDRLKN